MAFASAPRYRHGMIVLALLAAAAAPHPAELKTFQDWTVGCDNGAACHAVALMPEDWPEDGLTMSVRRGPEAGAQPVLAFELGADSNAASVSVDGKRLAVRLIGAEGQTRVAPADTAAMIGVLRSAGRVELQAADGKPLGTVSLKGASAALFYMDERQRRTGTATALVRPGTRPPPGPPPPLPVVTAPKPSSARPLALTAAGLAALRRKHGCTIDEVGGPDVAESAAIGPSESLLLLACGSGAYNVSHVPFVLRRGRGGVQATIAGFDVEPGWWGEEGKPVLINAAWEKERGLLTSFSKARGLGDCGTISDYAWDGRAFRLVEQREMGECRGSVDYITTWRARVVRK
ncbi:MAG TPA: DUF1176 domain-containing protein [Allosphingosinicella sp.]|nr:DUF1176 domain-containing protein [Allosphingosinicella sp.]